MGSVTAVDSTIFTGTAVEFSFFLNGNTYTGTVAQDMGGSYAIQTASGFVMMQESGLNFFPTMGSSLGEDQTTGHLRLWNMSSSPAMEGFTIYLYQTDGSTPLTLSDVMATGAAGGSAGDPYIQCLE